VGESPYVEAGARVQIEKLPLKFYRVTAFFGFMESPELPLVCEACAREGLELEMMKTTFFLGRETILPSTRPGMARWRKRLFAFMSRNAQQATSYFQVPPNRVVELGMQVEL
jgi:KUP system potassium uptake protein